MGMDRSMWCTGPLIHASGRRIGRTRDRWIVESVLPAGVPSVEVFTFVPARVEIDDKGRTKWTENAPRANMWMYKVTDPVNHEPVLKSCLRYLFERFPITTRPRM